jgi:hypothetical protein
MLFKMSRPIDGRLDAMCVAISFGLDMLGAVVNTSINSFIDSCGIFIIFTIPTTAALGIGNAIYIFQLYLERE